MNHYLYCCVQYVVSLHDIESRPIVFALVACDLTNGSVLLIGCMPKASLDRFSEIGRAVLQNIRQVLMRDIEDILRDGDETQVLSKLAARHRWNIHLSKATETSDDIEAVARFLLPRVEYSVRWPK